MLLMLLNIMLDSTATDERLTVKHMKGRGHGLTQLLHKHCLKGLRKTTETSVRTADVMAEFWINHILNLSLKHYCKTYLFDLHVFIFRFSDRVLDVKILWHIDPLLGNGSVNNPAAYVHATIEGHPSLRNGEVNTLGILGNSVFNAICAIAIWCNNRRTGKCFLCSPCWYNHDNVKQWGVAVSHSPVKLSQKMTVCQWFVNCCNQLYKGPINLIIKSKTRLLSHANPG
jgi:hypothetical protein